MKDKAKILLPSNTKFGFFFSVIFLSIAGYLSYYQLFVPAFFLLFLSLLFFVISVFRPEYLGPLNHIWFKIGMILNMIVSPVVLGVIFFLLITPIGFLGKLFGRDALRKNKSNSETFWLEREDKIIEPDSFKQQF